MIRGILSYIRRKLKGEKINNYWVQEVKIKRLKNRMEILTNLCENKKVIHFGCTDYPVFNPYNNLHLKLSKICSELHGIDIDKEGIEKLRGYFDSKYFYEISQLSGEKYDVCLVPETIEHVENISEFLGSVEKVNAEIFYISGPNCFHQDYLFRSHMKGVVNVDTFVEMVHPDHNCWFSPFTLKNVIQKYTNFKIKEIILSNHDKMVICICSR